MAPARYTLESVAAEVRRLRPAARARPCEPAAAEPSGAAARRGSRQRPMTDPSSGTDYLQQTTRFEPAAVEARWMKHWLDEHLFHAEPDPDRPPYSIVIPPPNITGVLHMGHALNDTVQDVLTRYHRMLGENACWLVGTDHAGIATQNVVEKTLRKEGLTKEDLGREEFVARVWEWRREYGGTIIEQLKRLGCVVRLRARALHLRRGLRARRDQRLRRPLRQGLHPQGQLPGQLVPALRHGHQRPRGGLPGHARDAQPHPLRRRRRRQRHHRHDASRDDARRHGRGGAPRRRALRGPRGQDGRPAAPGARAPDRRRRARRPVVRHRRAQDHAGARPHRLRHRPRRTGWRPSRPSARTAASPRPAARTPDSRSRRPPRA